MRALLICHEGATIDRDGLTRWLGSFGTLAGIVVIREGRQRTWQRIRREWRRGGPLGFLDVLLFRLVYRLVLAAGDREWLARTAVELCERYPPIAPPPVLVTSDPNSPEAEAFIREVAPDFAVARCKTLLKERIFSIPARGTFVMHPGICPEYRNSHGCFWALVRGDIGRVGMTLLRIDRGVDTGPVFGYYSYLYDEIHETHVRIQERVLLENLPAIAEKLKAICRDEATPIDTSGRDSAVWGQPRLTAYIAWKRRACRRFAPPVVRR